MQQETAPPEVRGKIEHLKRFLLLRLVWVMLFILVSESVINVLFGHFALPTINQFLGVDMNWSGQDVNTNMLMLLRLGLYVILSGFSRGLPFGASRTFPYLLDKFMLGDMKYLNNIPGYQKAVLVLILFVILTTYLLPYVLGILYYSGVVVQKMEEVREYDRQQREEFTRKRNLLLSDITHDLKTPITTLAGYAQALNDGMVTDPEKQKRYLDAIHRKSLEMSELITLLFHYVKMDSEGFTLKREKANMSELVLRVAASAYTDIESAGMDLDVDIPEEAFYADLDVAQFTRAVTNLTNNAIRHNDPGTTIRISITKDPESRTIRVSDTGNPIEESMLLTIFDPFVMGDESRNRRGGSGLGLSVTKKVIEMHGGKIYIEQPTESPYTKAFCIQMPAEEYGYGAEELAVSRD